MLDTSTLRDVAAQVAPELDERPDDSAIEALGEQLRPHLETLAAAFRKAREAGPLVYQGAQLFMHSALEAEA